MLMPRMTPRLLCMIYVPGVAILAAVALAACRLNMPVSMLTCDLAGLARLHPLAGCLSSLGVLLWCVTAAVSFFAAAVAAHRQENRQSAFLAGFAFLSTILMLDDLFMFHEYLSSEYLGLRQRYVILAYMALTAGLLAAFRKIILASDYTLLAAAIVFFVFSVGIEKAVAYHSDSWFYLAEDGSKFLGLISWAGYFIRYSWFQLTVPATLASSNEENPPWPL